MSNIIKHILLARRGLAVATPLPHQAGIDRRLKLADVWEHQPCTLSRVSYFFDRDIGTSKSCLPGCDCRWPQVWNFRGRTAETSFGTAEKSFKERRERQKGLNENLEEPRN